MRRQSGWIAAAVATPALLGGLLGASHLTQTATPTAPQAATLVNSQSLVTQFSPQTLASSAWNPTNQPGNCPTVNNGAKVNSSGYAEIDTTGATNDCRSMQSPASKLLPTAPGTIYEALIKFSSFHDWPALWMYGPNWPNQGEIDAVEGGPGQSYVTWHQAGNHTVGPDSWDNTVVPHAGGPNIQPNVWTTVDIAFTTTGVSVYYNGQDYVNIPETVTTGGHNPMYLTISEGSCNSDGTNVCNGGTSPAGNVQVQWVREYRTGGHILSTPTPTVPTKPKHTTPAVTLPKAAPIYGCVDNNALMDIFTSAASFKAFLAANGGKCPAGKAVTVG